MSSTTNTLLALAMGITLCGTAQAQAAAKKTPQRVSGPITITAKNGEWQEGVMIYTGDVVMISKTLELRGVRLEMRQPGGRQNPYEIFLVGSPATLKHLGDKPEDVVVNGRSAKMVYRSVGQTIQLTGDAHLERGKDELNGEDVRYDIANRSVQASGGSNGQVRIVIDVPEEQ